MGAMSRAFAHLAEPVSVKLLGEPSSRSPAALRWGRKYGLIVNTSGAHAGTYHDFSSGEHGDLIDLVMRETGQTFVAAQAWLHAFSSAGSWLLPAHRQPIVANSSKRWSNAAQSLWDYGEPLAGTIAETYLRSRACYIPAAHDLRFLTGDDKYPPAIVSRVTDFFTCDPITLHFTRIHPESGKIGAKFLAGHQKHGGVIRLLPIAGAGTALGVAEGLETALSVFCNGGHVTWAALDAGNLGSLPVNPCHSELYIWADNDPAGREGATKLADRYTMSGRSVRILLPQTEGADWNDVARGNAK